jgi:type I restriction enzyme R subunit
VNIAAFIRVINGIDRKKALEKYTELIKGAEFNAEQEQYLKNNLDYISINGDIQLKDFMEYPLKDYKWRDVFGDQFVCLKDFIKEMHKVIDVVA